MALLLVFEKILFGNYHFSAFVQHDKYGHLCVMEMLQMMSFVHLFSVLFNGSSAADCWCQVLLKPTGIVLIPLAAEYFPKHMGSETPRKKRLVTIIIEHPTIIFSNRRSTANWKFEEYFRSFFRSICLYINTESKLERKTELQKISWIWYNRSRLSDIVKQFDLSLFRNICRYVLFVYGWHCIDSVIMCTLHLVQYNMNN